MDNHWWYFIVMGVVLVGVLYSVWMGGASGGSEVALSSGCYFWENCIEICSTGLDCLLCVLSAPLNLGGCQMKTTTPEMLPNVPPIHDCCKAANAIIYEYVDWGLKCVELCENDNGCFQENYNECPNKIDKAYAKCIELGIVCYPDGGKN
jgi:hypothetical protein